VGQESAHLFALALSHALSAGKLLAAVNAFFCFSLTASAACIVNDLLDIEADRRHPQNRLRPFASATCRPYRDRPGGDLSAYGSPGGSLLPESFFGWLALCLAATLAYSVYLKRFAVVDVLVLSGLYILRLLAAAPPLRRISPNGWPASRSFSFFP